MLEEAKEHVKAAEADRILAEKLAAAKKKKPTKGKGKDPEPEAPAPEKEEKKVVKEEGPPNYQNNTDFLRCLRRACPRPFTFGPIKFSNLD